MSDKLTERMEEVLSVIVNNYIKYKEPTGSRILIKRYNISFSPATLRNVMYDLEEMGYLMHAYSSGGKIPTHKAYKFYINRLINDYKPIKNVEIDRFFKSHKLRRINEINDVVVGISDFISLISGFISLTSIMGISRIKFKKIDFIKVEKNIIIIVLVSLNNIIRTRKIYVDIDISEDVLHDISNFISKNYRGNMLVDVRDDLVHDITESGKICKLLLNELNDQAKSEEVIISGIKNVFNFKEFTNNVNKLKSIIDVLEKKKMMLDLLSYIVEHDKKIVLGDDLTIKELKEVGFVASTYEIKNEKLGVIAIMGPINMDYEEILGIVDFTSKKINNMLLKIGGYYGGD